MNSSNRYQSASTWSSRLRFSRTVVDGNSYLSFTPLRANFIWWISPIIILIVIFAKLSFVQGQDVPVVTYRSLTASIPNASENISVELSLSVPDDYVFPTHPNPIIGGPFLDGGLSVKVFSDDVVDPLNCLALWAFRFYPSERTKVANISIQVDSCNDIDNNSNGVIVIDFYDYWYTWRAGTHHDLRIPFGDGTYSKPLPTTTVTRPSAPTNLNATPGDGEISFSWAQPSDNGGESVIFEYHYGVGGTWIPVGTSTSVTVRSLANGTPITFYVRARNSAGSGSETSITASPESVIIAPSVPTNLVATPGDGEILFSWAQPSNNGGESVSYEYKHGTGDTWESAGSSTSVTVENLMNGTPITFYVRARNSAGESPQASITASSESVIIAPSVPTNLVATPGDGEILFSWGQSSNNGGEPVSYEYKYGTGDTWESAGTSTSVTVENLMNGTPITFYVRARNSAGESPQASITAIPEAEIDTPGAPQNLRWERNGGNDVKLNWGPPMVDGGSPVTGYEYKMNNSEWVTTNQGTSTEMEVEDLNIGKEYKFAVRAMNEMGPGSASNTIRTLLIDPPKPPENFNVEPGDGQVLLTWEAPSDDGGSKILYYEFCHDTCSQDSNWTSTGSKRKLFVVVENLTNGQLYNFQLRSVNSVGDSQPTMASATPDVGETFEIPRTAPEENLRRTSLLSFEAGAAQTVLNSIESRLKCLPRSQKQTSSTSEELLTLDYQRFMANRRSSGGFDNWFPEEGENITQDATVSKLLSSSAISRLGNYTNSSNYDSSCGFLLDFSSIWGNGAVTTFDTKKGETLIDGSLTSFTLGSDFTDESKVLGIGISLSEGWGDWKGTDEGKLDFSATGLYPYFGMNITDETSVWGVTGLGRGSITYKPKDEPEMKADTRSTLIAGGFRQALPAYLDNFDLSLKTNFFSVKTESEATSELTATDGNVTRTSIILEGSCDTGDGWCADLKPTFGVGVRYDGGDLAEGYSLVATGSVGSVDRESGISTHLNAQGVVLHEEDVHEVSISGTVRYDQNPTSDLGWSMSVSPTWGKSTYKGNHQNLGTKTITGLFDSSLQFAGTRIDSEIKYGTPIANGKFTGTTNFGYTYSDQVREYRVGYSVSERQSENYDLNLSLYVQRTEKVYEDDPNHSIGLRVGLIW